MPSPFPGMDPFLEGEEWEDFHTTFNTVIRETLSPQVEPRYIVRVGRRVYVEHPTDEQDQPRRADVAVLLTGAGGTPVEASTASVVTATAPVECLLPMLEETRETYLVIRERETREVVTVIETLSPGNKRPASDGRREYLTKRDEVLRSQAHLVEIDLLRGGQRLPMNSPLPQGDYYAIVSRQERRPRGRIYAWTIRNRLSGIPIPLKKGDPDVTLDLQTVFSTVYDRARYELSINYDIPLSPALNDSDAAWLVELLAG
ncbi:MAG: DUF4058 family protein [Planctomycetes bacterium]|nr:DUF4058 family protein [Planctomycetota bacterium]MBL7037564.1 DUF4058 family protein [Pirellulaceae bacterium]